MRKYWKGYRFSGMYAVWRSTTLHWTTKFGTGLNKVGKEMANATMETKHRDVLVVSVGPHPRSQLELDSDHMVPKALLYCTVIEN